MGGSFWDEIKSTAGQLVDKASETIKRRPAGPSSR